MSQENAKCCCCTSQEDDRARYDMIAEVIDR